MLPDSKYQLPVIKEFKEQQDLGLTANCLTGLWPDRTGSGDRRPGQHSQEQQQAVQGEVQ